MEYGLIGEKLGHSYSKQIHASIADYNFEIKEIAREDIDAFMKAKDFKAINVTIPYKETVIPYLDEIEETALRIGAVNTVINDKGRLLGYNTDFYGMVTLIKANGIELKGKKVLILGTGGTCKTSFCVAESLGASSIYKVSRSGKDESLTYEEVLSKHTDADIIINTTPCGMFPNVDSTPIDLKLFNKLSGVIDAIYHPLRSNLVLEAEKLNIPTCGGLLMLAAQAVKGCEKFLNTSFDESVAIKAYKNVLFEMRNIVLIGMPSAGKTTVGKVLAKRTGKVFVDTDDVIKEKIGSTIKEFFDTKGEEAFRDIETEVIKELSNKPNLIIATGGGAVLREENVRALKRDGLIYMLDRSIDKLTPTSDRPLLQNREMLESLFAKRYRIYINTADVIIDANGTIDEVANAILNDCQ
ncbi:MAG: shikimate dehydrogenase [Lachnospiraceae bacterium]|nr:shikimate dehydrogenase [Lachnospiraceae bacterium]